MDNNYGSNTGTLLIVSVVLAVLSIILVFL